MAEPRLRYCLEDLLKFTLECHVKGTLEIDLGLPTDFCSYLLLNHPISDTNSTQGDTLHPLYKHLSSTLLRIHHIKDGFKTIEGRCAGGDYNRIGSGALILFNKCLVLEVKEVRSSTGGSTVKTRKGPVVLIAICIEKLAAQPYMYLAKFVSGLGYKGIRSLLGLNPTSSHEFSS
ncbi:hypothetical protein M0R45_011089 [Rubus argutus]|uniref:Uncharacterized protein n=1 Tax=Rubus argutus TaxID=59490 RepID=A0AAW1YBP5_RUBAR